MGYERYFELNEDVGVEPDFLTDPETGEPVENPRAGELQPINDVGVAAAVPRMIGGELTQDVVRISVQDDGKELEKVSDRVVVARHPAVAQGLVESGQYHEVDPPAAGRPSGRVTRATLNEQARAVGVADPESLSNVDEVRAAIDEAVAAGDVVPPSPSEVADPPEPPEPAASAEKE